MDYKKNGERGNIGMKRIGALLLCILFVFLSVSLPTLALETDGTLSAGNLTPKPGDTFSIALNLSGNTSLNAFRLFVDFDPSVLTFSDVADGVLVEGIESVTLSGGNGQNARVALIWNDAEAFVGDGLLCRISFVLSSEVLPGSQTVVTVSGDTEEGWCLNGDLEPYAFSPATVNILAAYPCDITFDENGVTTDIAIGSNVSDVVSEMESGGYSDVSVLNCEGQEKSWNDPIATGDQITVGSHVFYVSVLGDLNGDGGQSVTDYIIMRSEILSSDVLSGVYLTAADLNADGSISVTDYVILRAILLAQ